MPIIPRNINRKLSSAAVSITLAVSGERQEIVVASRRTNTTDKLVTMAEADDTNLSAELLQALNDQNQAKIDACVNDETVKRWIDRRVKVASIDAPRGHVPDDPTATTTCLGFAARSVLLQNCIASRHNTSRQNTPGDLTLHCVSPHDITYMYMYMYKVTYMYMYMYKVTYMYMCLYMYYMYTYSILYTYTAPVHVSHDLRHNISRHDVSRQSNHKKTHFKARQRPNEQAVHSEHWGHSHPMTSRSDGLEHSRRSPGNR